MDGVAFKKIFNLDPSEVENFLRNKVAAQFVKSKWDEKMEDYFVQVEWMVPNEEFYVHLEPKLHTIDYKKWSFKEKEDISAGEYFSLCKQHWHFSFEEVYDEMKEEQTI